MLRYIGLSKNMLVLLSNLWDYLKQQRSIANQGYQKRKVFLQTNFKINLRVEKDYEKWEKLQL